jgi:restriction endonuclease S subunit
MGTLQMVFFSDVTTVKRMDAEYWITAVDPSRRITKTGVLQDLCEFIRTGPMGSAVRSREYRTQGIPVLRPSNLGQLISDSGSLVYVEEAFLQKRKLHSYKNEDILLSRVGDVKIGMVYGFETGVTISSNLVGLRVKNDLIDPYFLFAFLHTFGVKDQLDRSSKKGSLQTLGIKEIGKLVVPVFPMEQQKGIGMLQRQALAAKLESVKILAKVTQFFSQAIENNTFRSEVSFLTNLAQTQETKRMDAEFFFSRHTNLKDVASIRFGEIAAFQRGIEVGRTQYRKNGRLFWRVGNISNIGLLPKSQKYVDSVLYEKLKQQYQPNIGELLLVKDGKPGVCMVIEDLVEGIVSEGIVRVTMKEFDPYYVAACIQSDFCQEQIRKHADGSLVPHWKMEQIERLEIPVFDDSIQEKIVGLMKRAYAKEKESERLREEAKKELEMIC